MVNQQRSLNFLISEKIYEYLKKSSQIHKIDENMFDLAIESVLNEAYKTSESL